MNPLGLESMKEAEKVLPIQSIGTDAGFDLWLVEDHTLPIVVMKCFFIGAGSAFDSPSKQGTARLLSNMLDEGAGAIESQNFQKELTDHSITLAFGAGREGFSGELKSLRKEWDRGISLMALALQKPRFDLAPLERMKAANIARVRSSVSDPQWRAARLLNARAFEGQAYAQNSGGTLSSLPSITSDDLRYFKKNHLTRDRLLVVFVGDLNAQEAKEAAEKIFSSLPEKAASPQPPVSAIKNTGHVFFHPFPSASQTVVQAVLPVFGKDDPDNPALQLLNYIYGGSGFGSKLMAEAREKRGLTYGIYSSLDQGPFVNVLSVSTSTKNQTAGEILGIINDEMKALREKPVDAKSLSDAKAYMTGALPLALTNTEDIADTVLSLRVSGFSLDYLDHFSEKIEAVSAEDIQRVARRIFLPENLVVALVGQPEGISNFITVKELPDVQ